MKFFFYITIVLQPICLIAQIPKQDLLIWLKSDSVKVDKNNKVIKWIDQSGNQNNAKSSSALNPPTFVPDELNNFPVIRFNGINESLETDKLQTFPNKRGTIIVVSKFFGPGKSSSGGTNTFVSTYFGKKITWQLCTVNELCVYYDGVGADGTPVAALKENNWEVITLLRFNDSTFRLYRKGEPRVVFNVHNNQPDSNNIKIGSNGKLEVLNGDIAEIIIYNRALNENEIFEVNNYLLSKYQIKLPVITLTESIWYSIAIFLFILLTIVIVIKYITTKKLKKRILHLKYLQQLDLERQRISREMHDDIGAGLTQISLISEAIKNKINAKDEAEAIANTSRKLVSSMNEIIWSLSTEYTSLQDLFAYLRELINSLLEYSKIDYNIAFPDNHNTITLTSHQRRNIVLVVKEIINNSIKYSKAKEIIISATVEDNSLLLTIIDNGIGFNVNECKKGNGLNNIKHRINEINGTFSMNSIIGKYTKFYLCIPLK